MPHSGIEKLIAINREASRAFVRDEILRQRFKARHGVEIAFGKCIDERIQPAAWGGIPAGVTHPFRSKGGKFRFRWDHLADVIDGIVDICDETGRTCVFGSTYHYSAGSAERGCAGWKLDTNAARESASRFMQELAEVYPGVMYPLVIGLETDNEGFVFHGREDGRIVDIANPESWGMPDVGSVVRDLFPDAPPEVSAFLAELASKNERHIARVKASGRIPSQAVHKGWTIGFGRMFDWLHGKNIALLVGPFEPTRSDSLAVAARILAKSFAAHEDVQQEEPVLLVQKPFPHPKKFRKVEAQALYLAEEAVEVVGRTLREVSPDLWRRMGLLVGCVDLETRMFHEVKRIERLG